MKAYGMIMMILIVMSGVAYAEDVAVQLDTDQTVYEESQQEADEEAVAAGTQLEEYGNMVLEPIEAVKDTANEFVNPGMELVYESDQDGEDYPAEGPKFKANF